MRNKDELQSGISEILRYLRHKKGLSKNRLAEMVGVDAHTYNAWESGKSCPSFIDLISCFEVTNESMMKPVLEYLYPALSDHNEHEQKRERIVQFIANDATDHMIDILSYLIHGDHGSNLSPQLEMYCAYNHLPLEQRFLIAESIYVAYKMHMHIGDIVSGQEVLPDMPILEDGLKQVQKSAYKRMKSYTTITDPGDDKQ